MTDFKKITQTEIVQRLEILPAPLLAAIESKAYREKIESLLKEINIDTPENRKTFNSLVGYIILGILPSNTDDLGEDLNALLDFNDIEAAEILADKILDILDPILSLIEESALPLGTFAETQSEVITPKDMANPVSAKFTPPTTTTTLAAGLTKPQGGSDKPFFIHTETKFSPVAKAQEEVKPTLSLSQRISSMFKSAKPSTTNSAKIGIGAPAPKPKKIEGVVKTEMATPRIVHYGEMKTALGKAPVPPPPNPGAQPGQPSQRPAPVPLGSIGRPAPSPAPMPRPTMGQAVVPMPQPIPKPVQMPVPPAPKQATSWKIDDPAHELPAAPSVKPQELPTILPGVKGVPPPPPSTPQK